MISFDTENDESGNLTLCIFYNGKDFNIFDYKDYKSNFEMQLAIFNYVQNNNEKLFLAHNLEYDLTNLTKPFLIKYFDWYYSGRLLFAKLHNTKKEFLDTFNFSFSSLKEIGESIGIKKLETDDFYNIDYCKQDALIVYKFYENFKNSMEKLNYKKKKFTLAGTSQDLFLTKYNDKKIDEINVNDELLKSYYGGRCEAFYIGQVNNYIAELDYNSMYPYVMLNNKYPVSENYISIKPQEKVYISQIKVKIKENVKFPILPYRDKKLFFPVGEFTTYATSAEIKKAQDENQIEKITYLKTFNFANVEFIFSDFVNYFYGKRKVFKDNGDIFNSNLYKRLLNSVYGRFCMNKEMKVLTAITKENENNIERLNDEIGYLTIENNSDKYKNYAIGIFITAYARIKLYELIKQAEQKKYKILYCDTDSVYFSSPLNLNTFVNNVYNDFCINSALGNLSFNLYLSGNFQNAKMYFLKSIGDIEKIKIKGVPKANRKEFFEKGKTKFKRPLKLRSSLHSIQEKEANIWYEIEYYKRSNYNKRKVFKNGNTKPIKIKAC